MIFQYPGVPNFNPFRLTASRFRGTGHCETSTLSSPQMALTITRSKVTHICISSIPRVPNFNQFPCIVRHDPEHYEIIKFFHIASTSSPRVPNFEFASRPPYSSCRTLFRPVGRVIPNDLEHYNVKAVPYIITP